MLSLDFVPDPMVAKFVVESAARAQSWDTTPVVLTLLAHSNPQIQAEVYQQFHQVVIASIGAGQARDPISYIPENISFLAQVKVIQEIICFGLDNDNPKVIYRQYFVISYV